MPAKPGRHGARRALAVAAALLLSACGLTGRGRSTVEPLMVGIRSGVAARDVTLVRGQGLVVRLPSNATTGFRWTLRDAAGPVLTLDEPAQYVPDRAAPGVVGSGGTEVWKFTWRNPGVQSLRFEYRRPWEGGVQPARSVVVTVSAR